MGTTNIIFTNSIKNVRVYKKCRLWDTNYKVHKQFKRKIGRKYLIFPVYDIVENVVVKTNGLFDTQEEYHSTVDEYNKTSKYSYIENDIIYEKPHCRIWFGDKSYEEKYFDSVAELDDFIETYIMPIGNALIIDQPDN